MTSTRKQVLAISELL